MHSVVYIRNKRNLFFFYKYLEKVGLRIIVKEFENKDIY